MTAQNNTHSSANSALRIAVMNRVRTIHALQTVFNGTVASVGIFMLALYGIGREVWVSRVLQNMPSLTDAANIGAILHFYLAAFMDTRLIVQILTVIAVSAVIWLAYNIIQMARTTRISLRFA